MIVVFIFCLFMIKNEIILVEFVFLIVGVFERIFVECIWCYLIYGVKVWF